MIQVDCQVGLVVIVIGTPSETGMTEVDVPPPQHQLQGVECTHNILCIFNLHTVYIQ
jgi:hypothetical protein